MLFCYQFPIFIFLVWKLIEFSSRKLEILKKWNTIWKNTISLFTDQIKRYDTYANIMKERRLHERCDGVLKPSLFPSLRTAVIRTVTHWVFERNPPLCNSVSYWTFTICSYIHIQDEKMIMFDNQNIPYLLKLGNENYSQEIFAS